MILRGTTWRPLGDHLETTRGPLGDYLGTTWRPIVPPLVPTLVPPIVPPLHSEPLRSSDMGSVQNLIGMPSNGYVPKVAV